MRIKQIFNYCIYTRVIRYEQPFIKEEKAVLLMSQFMRALAVNTCDLIMLVTGRRAMHVLIMRLIIFENVMRL